MPKAHLWRDEPAAVWHNPLEMKIVIVSINHGIQLAPLKGEVPIPEEKEQLRTLVREMIAAHNIDLICEESDPCQLSIAQEAAHRHDPHIPWKNINMTSQERLEAGIWGALLYRRSETKFLDDHSGITIEYRIPEDDIRDEFFRDEILKASTATGARSVLVLCGDMHTEPLKSKLEATGHEAEANHDLTPEKHWK